MTSQLNDGEEIVVAPDTFTHNTLPERDFWSPTEVTEHFGPDAVERLKKSGNDPQWLAAFTRDQVATLGTPLPSPQTQDRVVVDLDNRTVSFRDQQLFLGTTNSLKLLAYLAANPNRCCSYGMVASSVWKKRQVQDSTVNKEINRLKKKLAAANYRGLTFDMIGGGVKLIIDPPTSLPPSTEHTRSDQQSVELTV